MNKNASQLGKLAKGKPKTMSRAAIAQRTRAGFKKGNKAASCLQARSLVPR
jgi:hypothetical protein